MMHGLHPQFQELERRLQDRGGEKNKKTFRCTVRILDAGKRTGSAHPRPTTPILIEGAGPDILSM